MTEDECREEREGLAVVISGPSGIGKTTVTRRLVQKYGYGRSISATTRPPRTCEKDGSDYRFTDRGEFMIGVREQNFLEHSEHFNNLYGTPKAPVMQAIAEGRTILLEIDVNGARQVIEQLPPKNRLCIFLYASDQAAQERRLRGRNTDTEESMRTRLDRPELNMARGVNYDAWVKNDDIECAVEEVHALIQKAEAGKANGC